MSDLLINTDGAIFTLTLNRPDKHNAFDDALIQKMQDAIDEAIVLPDIRIIVLKAMGKHFSAGADLSWMQKMANFSEQQNEADAMALAKLMFTLHASPKPTIAIVQGSAYGGGAGLVAACDMAIGADNAEFCFSEVKLGLIPAVISPHVINAIGRRAALYYFTTAAKINADEALRLNLINQKVSLADLNSAEYALCKQLLNNAPGAITESKALVETVSLSPITADILDYTAKAIAKRRVSSEGQRGLKAFLAKLPIQWNA